MWPPIPLSARSLSRRKFRVVKVSMAGPLDFERFAQMHVAVAAVPVLPGLRALIVVLLIREDDVCSWYRSLEHISLGDAHGIGRTGGVPAGS